MGESKFDRVEAAEGFFKNNVEITSATPDFTSAYPITKTGAAALSVGAAARFAVNGTTGTISGDGGITTSGNVATTGSGTITSAGTLAATGAATVGTTLGVTGNLSVGDGKFDVTASNGNTQIDGTLNVDGTITVDGASQLTGNVEIGATKFSVTAATGNTQIDGTLNVDGVSTLAGDVAIGAGKLAVTASSGNITGPTAAWVIDNTGATSIGATNSTSIILGKASQAIDIGGGSGAGKLSLASNGTLGLNSITALKYTSTAVNTTDTIANTVPTMGKVLICTHAGPVAVALPEVLAQEGSQFWILAGTAGDINMTAATGGTLMCVGNAAAGVIKITDIGSGVWFISTGTKWLCIPLGISYTVTS